MLRNGKNRNKGGRPAGSGNKGPLKPELEDLLANTQEELAVTSAQLKSAMDKIAKLEGEWK